MPLFTSDKYNEECIEWEVDRQQMGIPFLLQGRFHGNDRYRYPSDHPFRTGRFRRCLINLGLWQPPADNSPCPLVDFSEDIATTTMVSAAAGYGFQFISPTNPHHSWNNHAPYWAGKLLNKVTFARYFLATFAIGATYFGIYNFLTGVRGWPVTKYGDMHVAANIVASAPTAMLFAYFRRMPALRPGNAIGNRMGFFYQAWFWTSVFFVSYNWCLANGYDDSNIPHADEYYRELRNAPGFEIVSKLPHLPFYKESPIMVWSNHRNPFYDAEYVRTAKANAKTVLAQYSL